MSTEAWKRLAMSLYCGALILLMLVWLGATMGWL